MSEQVISVTAEYIEAHKAAEKYNPGQQPDIASKMRAAFEHGYAQALIDKHEHRWRAHTAETETCACGAIRGI